MVPKGWAIQPLENIAIVERGKFSARPRNDPQYYGGAIPFVQTGDIASSGGVLRTFTQTLNEKGLSVSKLFPKGTILVTIAANIGDVAITEIDVACPDSLVAVRAKEGICPMWLRYCLESRKNDLISAATQNAQKNINLQVLRPLQLKVPPPDEQYRIGQVLHAWDKAIDSLRGLVAAKQARKRALMQELLSGRKRFAEFADKPWKPTPIRELIKESRILGSDGRTAKKITVKLYGKGVVGKEEKQLGSVNTKYYVRRAGQFIYSKLDFLNGAFGVIPQSLDGYETTLDLPCFDFTDKIVPEYFLSYVTREEFYSSFLGSAIGGRKARRISPDELLNREILLPEKAEQQKIAALISAADAEITNLQKQLERLKKQKQGLMEQLLTGKKRINAKPKAA